MLQMAVLLQLQQRLPYWFHQFLLWHRPLQFAQELRNLYRNTNQRWYTYLSVEEEWYKYQWCNVIYLYRKYSGRRRHHYLSNDGNGYLYFNCTLERHYNVGYFCFYIGICN